MFENMLNEHAQVYPNSELHVQCICFIFVWSVAQALTKSEPRRNCTHPGSWIVTCNVTVKNLHQSGMKK